MSARWIPRLLTEEEKQVRVSASMTFLRKVESDSIFLSRIINTDEDKRMPMVWKHLKSPTKEGEGYNIHRKSDVYRLSGHQRIVLVHMVNPERTVNVDYHSKVNYFS